MPNLTAQSGWNGEMPQALVVTCSDGRFMKHFDEFAQFELGLSSYDRLIVPGGGGALSLGGDNAHRGELLRQDCRFLIMAHGIKELILLFHGPTADGPMESICADYQRRLHRADASAIRRRQEQDAMELLRLNWGHPLRVQAWRCEVGLDQSVQFVKLPSCVSSPRYARQFQGRVLS